MIEYNLVDDLCLCKENPLELQFQGGYFYAISNKTLTYCKQYDII